MPHTTISMSQKELDRYDIIKRVINHELTGVKAAKLLCLSVRHVKRLKASVIKYGAHGLIHKNRGKPSNRRICDKEHNIIINLIHKHYKGFKPTHLSEKLMDIHNINRDPKTIRSIMISEDIWKPRKCKSKHKHRSWRMRKEHYGQMMQFDGSYHDWFEGRDDIGEACLLLAIDDATGKITKAEFAQHEGVLPVFSFWKDYVLIHGKPRTIYLDKFSTYKMNQAVAKDNHETRTQFQRAMESLQIEDISAHSPEAKGRVERAFETLQDRLVKEMRLAGINTWEQGNIFMKDIFVPWFNKRYGIEAQIQGDLHRPLTIKEKNKLDSIFSRHTTRTVNNDFTISFNKCWYQLIIKQPVTVCKKDKVVVEERLDHGIHIRLRDKSLNYEIIPNRKPKVTKHVPWVIPASNDYKDDKMVPQKTIKPTIDHPWRKRIHSEIHAR